ncbi:MULTISPECIES: ribbon-helix-helix domain-containing protein [unclassified Mesorhizobium]|uniref:CopG family ribbon-helix-helix protein n=1 Tax=unclassified Mesorhizobium TaxID=325217 RepID=UPI000FE9DE3C|nr:MULTISPECIES: ribbon-helix-helix domain-containing protein [unclassified Mesorhizobium]RWC30063.1 MAG: ribbon-helix-helix protein, CopG family [Mesorhizobium sp.]TGQ73000.1 ribbon-helix-helix protein, CopG family [bacterium M00.F.Ca.ET.205.01.1.1]TGU53756.1 ribbon-helix-helix protein, CopG family [bacterium M00.F.Ca.ET.152.01.1.1]TGV37629.1 ribbon-helix-helix protein, CopG family [Mesorhizobium sp. M00.F.Ca.ET.186.01.1.1]TGZ39375.1 ribbon-helix-helix protein, CopG family [bacterium M00.F.Ca
MATEDKTQVSLRVPAAMLADFERIATALDRDRTWVMLRAFRVYLDGEGGHLLDEMKGIEELDAGQVVDFDEVMDKADAIIAAARNSRQAKVG